MTESEAAGTALSPVKPVNLLPEIPVQTGRKLNDREQRDCEVMISSSRLVRPAILFGRITTPLCEEKKNEFSLVQT